MSPGGNSEQSVTCAAERIELGSGVRDMSPFLDPLSLKYVSYARSVRLETLDIGCGDGLAAAAALERGGYVVAVDPESTLLERLRARVPVEQQTRLRAVQGRLPSIDFDYGRFAAVHAAHVFEHLDDDELAASIRKIYGWMKTHGLLFVSVVGHSSHRWESPLKRCGFEIDEVSSYPLPWNESQLCLAIVARRPAESANG